MFCKGKSIQCSRRSGPCDHSRKRPALVKARLVKPRLNCNLTLQRRALVSEGATFSESQII